MIPDSLIILWLFAVGACVGSFLNVVVYRLPRGQSLVFPGSRCPQCEHSLAWYDNVPVFGWIFLAGKCRYCRKPISTRYPIVEATMGLIFAGFYVAVFIFHQGPFWAIYDGPDLIEVHRMESLREAWPIFSLYLVGAAILLATSLIDAELYLIPLPLPLIMAGTGVVVHSLIDRPGMAGSLTADPTAMALAAGGGIGLLLSIVLLRLGIFPLSFAEGESALEVDKLKQKADEPPEGPEYTPGQIRKEISKEMLFLLPSLVLGGIAVLLQMRFGIFDELSKIDWLSGFLGSIMGGLAGGFIVWFSRIVFSYWLGKEAMGLGDIDLMFAVGTVIGPSAAIVAFLIAPFFGLPLALINFLLKSRRQLPYVPYLSLATFALMLFYFPIYDYLRPGLIGLATMVGNLL